jgi:hypothetical protein
MRYIKLQKSKIHLISVKLNIAIYETAKCEGVVAVKKLALRKVLLFSIMR